MGGNEVFGTPNEDKLLAKDVKRALVLIYRTTRSLELPYLYAVTYFHCTLPPLTGTWVQVHCRFSPFSASFDKRSQDPSLSAECAPQTDARA